MALDSTKTEQSHKSHRSRQAGPKKKSKSDKKNKNVSDSDRKQNPKVSIPFHYHHLLHCFSTIFQTHQNIFVFVCFCRHLLLVRLWRRSDYSHGLWRKSSEGFMFRLSIGLMVSRRLSLLWCKDLLRYLKFFFFFFSVYVFCDVFVAHSGLEA